MTAVPRAHGSRVGSVPRAGELRRVDQACEAAAAGRGTLVLVSGEAGIGKTWFCTAVSERARQHGLRETTVSCWADVGLPALWPWQPILRELCDPAVSDLLAATGPDQGQRGVGSDRFTSFAAVVDRLAESCRRSPACIVIDDLHVADSGALLLTRLLTRAIERLPLVLVVSRRTGEPSPTLPESRLLDELDRAATAIMLQPFDLEETADFLAGHGLVDLDADLAVTIFRLTGGNPLFLRRIVALGLPATHGDLPAGLSPAIEQAVTALSPAAQRVLRLGAILGPNPSVSRAAAVAGCDAATVMDAVDEGAARGLVRSDGTNRFAFGHELVRLVLRDGLTGAEQLDAHARAAAAFNRDATGSPARLASRAHHALAAAPRSPADAAVAVQACEEAARSMMRSFAYEQADALLSAAVALGDSPDLAAPSSGILLRWAHAARCCGRLAEARRRYERAAAAAELDEDAVVLAEAALGLGGYGVYELRNPAERARMLARQRAALHGLDETDPDQRRLRRRLEVRLAAETAIEGGSTDSVLAAIEAARERGDRAVLAEALALGHAVLLTPEHGTTRVALAEELVTVAAEVGHGALTLMGLCCRATDLFHLGAEGATAALEDLRQRAGELGSQYFLYVTAVIDVMLLTRAGRLKDAEVEAMRCYEYGLAVGEVNVSTYLAAQRLVIRWIQGHGGLGELAEDAAGSPSLVTHDFAFRAVAAAFAAQDGDDERARIALDALTADGLAALRPSSGWLVGMTAIVDLAARLDDGAVAREAYDLLAPFADLPTIGGLGVVCLGSVERALGIAAGAFGNHDRAVEHLRRAIAANRRLGNEPLATIARADLATALARRRGPGDVDDAIDVLGQAAADAEHLGMTHRAAGWRDEQAALLERKDERVPARSSPVVARRGVIEHQGSRWLVALDEHRVRVPNLTGMGYLAELLTRPGRAIPALTLTGRGPGPTEPTRHAVIDDEARAAYAARGRELVAELDEAEANNDLARAQRLRLELDALIDEIDRTTGLSGRPRLFADDTERARTAVRKAIKRAIDVIDDANPSIAEELRTTVSTGSTCLYTPSSPRPVLWSTRADA